MTGDINLQAQTRTWLSHSVLHPYVPGPACSTAFEHGGRAAVLSGSETASRRHRRG